MITTPKPPNGDNDSRVVQIENEVMDLSLSISRLQGSQVEFQQEQANTNKQIFDMLNLINSKFDNLVRSSRVEVPSSVPHIPKDINVGERSDCVASLAESLPKWYKFDLSSYDGEAVPRLGFVDVSNSLKLKKWLHLIKLCLPLFISLEMLNYGFTAIRRRT